MSRAAVEGEHAGGGEPANVSDFEIECVTARTRRGRPPPDRRSSAPSSAAALTVGVAVSRADRCAPSRQEGREEEKAQRAGSNLSTIAGMSAESRHLLTGWQDRVLLAAISFEESRWLPAKALRRISGVWGGFRDALVPCQLRPPRAGAHSSSSGPPGQQGLRRAAAHAREADVSRRGRQHGLHALPVAQQRRHRVPGAMVGRGASGSSPRKPG